MDGESLRALQAPLKQQYRERAGVGGHHAHGRGRHRRRGHRLQGGDRAARSSTAGLHPATGGSGLEACSGDMLLEALVACAGVTLKAVATAIGVELRSAHVRAEGDLDFRGTLGVDREAPVGFRDIRLTFELASDAPQEQLDQLLKLTERYCVVLQTLRSRRRPPRRRSRSYRRLTSSVRPSIRSITTFAPTAAPVAARAFQRSPSIVT